MGSKDAERQGANPEPIAGPPGSYCVRPGRDVILHAENGVLGFGEAPPSGHEDWDLIIRLAWRFGMFHVVPLPYLFQGLLSRSTPFYQGGTLSSPPPSSFPNQVAQLEVPSTVGASIVAFSPDPAYKMQWNLNIQRQLTRREQTRA